MKSSTVKKLTLARSFFSKVVGSRFSKFAVRFSFPGTVRTLGRIPPQGISEDFKLLLGTCAYGNLTSNSSPVFSSATSTLPLPSSTGFSIVALNPLSSSALDYVLQGTCVAGRLYPTVGALQVSAWVVCVWAALV